MDLMGRVGRRETLLGAMLALGCGSSARGAGGGGAGGIAAGESGAGTGAQGGDALFGGGTSGVGTSGQGGALSGAGEAGKADAVAGAAGSGNAAGMIPASAAMPCGAGCDAAGFQCVANACRGGEGALLWQHRLNERYVDSVGDIASDSKGNAIVGFTTEVRTPALANRAFVRKFDVNGGQLWEHAFLGDRYGLLTAIVVDAQDRSYVGGSLGPGESGFIRILDADGKLVRQIDYTPEELRWLDHLALDPSGNLIVAGSTGVQPVRPVVLKKLDASGNQLWSKTYHDGGIHYSGFHVATTSEGNLLLATGDANAQSAFIGAFDPSGNALWTDNYMAAHAASTGILPGDNGEVLAVGVFDNHSWLRRYSATGALLDGKLLSEDGRSLLGFAAGGGALYVGGDMSTPGHPLQAWIRRMASDGQPVGWQMSDALDAFVYGRTVEHLVITPQGDVLATGVFDWHADRSVWVARFAGPQGGSPRVDANSVPKLLTNTFPDHDDSAIFLDKEVPECDATNSYQLTGSLGSETLSYQSSGASNFLATSLELPSLVLKWKDFVQEGTAMPLTGDRLMLPAGQPHAGEALCITGGDMAVLPATYQPNPGRAFKFRITTGSLGADCKGPSVAVDIKGCFYRFTNYLP